ncbi:unnamed protein product, partial [Brassica oleracea var. botrytis]
LVRTTRYILSSRTKEYCVLSTLSGIRLLLEGHLFLEVPLSEWTQQQYV